MNRMKVIQEVHPDAPAKRMSSTEVSNLVLHLMMDWHTYRHLGMTPAVRDRTIAGLRNGTVEPRVLCETLGIPYKKVTASERDRSILADASADLERALEAGANILGGA